MTEILGRDVQAFASGVDPINDVIFENFMLARSASEMWARPPASG